MIMLTDEWIQYQADFFLQIKIVFTALLIIIQGIQGQSHTGTCTYWTASARVR